MKKYVTKLFTILVSGAVIASTVLVSSLSGADAQSMTVRKETVAKGSSFQYSKEISIRNLNFNQLVSNNSGEKDSDNTGDPVVPGTSEAKTTTTATESTAVSTAVSTTSKPTATTTSKPKTTTTVKIPTDESNNIKYVKDPDYKSPYYIVVYTGSQSAVVYGKDQSGAYNRQIKAFTVSTGRHNVSPTRKGVYKIRAKYRWRKLMGDCYGQYSSSISPDYLFHSVPYARRSVDSLYNASYNNLGRAVSHGCIRMCVRDCKWIFDNCPIGTQVHVVWESGPKGAGVPKRKSGSRYSGWDPSDQWAPGNPYFNGVSTTESEPVTTAKTTTTKKTTKSTAVSSSTVTSTSATKASQTSTEKTTSSTGTSDTTATTTTTSGKKTTTTTTTAPEVSSEVAVG